MMLAECLVKEARAQGPAMAHKDHPGPWLTIAEEYHVRLKWAGSSGMLVKWS